MAEKLIEEERTAGFNRTFMELKYADKDIPDHIPTEF